MIRLFRIHSVLMKKIRTKVWSLLFLNLGNGSRIAGRIKVYFPENISIGSDTIINEGVVLNARAPITIGNHCHISPGVIINTGSLDLGVHYLKREHRAESVIIGEGVWIGSGAIINPGVKIGEGAVVGAGSVVTGDIATFSVVVGVPARVVRLLSSDISA